MPQHLNLPFTGLIDPEHWPGRPQLLMDDATAYRAPTALTAVCAVVACAAAMIFAFQSLLAELWLDELLTVTLLQAQSLSKMWAGIVSGIDGNPPLYLTLAWLFTHAMPSFVPKVAALKLVNLAATIAGVVALYRASLRVASPLACWIGTFVFAALNENLVYVAFELRTYALYFLLAALSVLFLQRLIEGGRRRDLLALAIINAALTLSHTFGVAYVGCISLAGALSLPRGGGLTIRLIILACCPALIVFVCWLPFFISQSAVGRPYIWIEPPDLTDLLRSVFATPLLTWISIVELYVLAGAAFVAARRYRMRDVATLAFDASWQPWRYALLLVLGMSGVTLSIWIVSLVAFPLFVPRYFTPQLIITLAINVAFSELVLRLIRDRLHIGPSRFATAATVLLVVLFAAALLDRDPQRKGVPCADMAGNAFEDAFVDARLPVIAESPHIWLPRATYAGHAANYKFPLDWDVVLKYPQRARGNATDYHIMESLKSWSGTSAILTTDDLIKTFPEFYVIEQPGRAWFYNLRNTRDVAAVRLADASGGDACTLWKVTSVRPKP